MQKSSAECRFKVEIEDKSEIFFKYIKDNIFQYVVSFMLLGRMNVNVICEVIDELPASILPGQLHNTFLK